MSKLVAGQSRSQVEPMGLDAAPQVPTVAVESKSVKGVQKPRATDVLEGISKIGPVEEEEGGGGMNVQVWVPTQVPATHW
jgi:hypothetical protein